MHPTAPTRQKGLSIGIGNLWRTADSISENMKDPALSDLYHLLLYYGSYRTKIEGTILAPHDL